MGRQLKMSGILDVLWWCLLEVSSSTLLWTLMSWGTVIPQVTLPEINSADSYSVISLCVCLAPESVISQEFVRVFCGIVLLGTLFLQYSWKTLQFDIICLSWCNLETHLSSVLQWQVWGEIRGFTSNCTKTRTHQYNILSEVQRLKCCLESLDSIIYWIELAMPWFFFRDDFKLWSVSTYSWCRQDNGRQGRFFI